MKYKLEFQPRKQRLPDAPRVKLDKMWYNLPKPEFAELLPEWFIGSSASLSDFFEIMFSTEKGEMNCWGWPIEVILLSFSVLWEILKKKSVFWFYFFFRSAVKSVVWL